MKMMHKSVLAAILLAIAIPALAGNSNSNPCGNNGNNCDTVGGNATASGGSANAGAIAGAAAGAISGSHSSVGDVTNVAAGGDGGSAISISEGGKGGAGGSSIATGGIGLGGNGGDAKQGQGQGQKQSNVGINGQSLDSAVDASSANDNRSNAAGNTTSTVVTTNVERNAPPVYLGQLTATMSCSGSFNAGSSSPGGAGAFGFTWISADCRSVVSADKFREIGMVDTACRILKTTKGFKRAAKADSALRDVSCALAK